MTQDNPTTEAKADTTAAIPTKKDNHIYHSNPHDGTICLQIAREFCFELGRAYELIWRAEDYIDPKLPKYDAAVRDYKAAYYYVESWRAYMDLSYMQIERPSQITFTDKLLRISDTFPPYKREMIAGLHTLLLMTSDPKLRANNRKTIDHTVDALLRDIARATYLAKAQSQANVIGRTDLSNAYMAGATWAYDQLCGEDAPWKTINKIVD